MKKPLCLLLIYALCLSACAAVKLTEQDAKIILAKKVDRNFNVSEITDLFTYEGQIYVYTTLVWDVDKAGGRQEFEAKWYNGDRLISRFARTYTLDYNPYYVWFRIRGTALGAGSCRVEIFANGSFLGSKSFTVSEN
jgi:hypothetical protein